MNYLKIVALAVMITGSFLYYRQLAKYTTTLHEVDKPVQKVNLTVLKKGIEHAMKTLLSTLQGIDNLTSAKAAVPVLEEINKNLKSYEPQIYEISTGERRHIKQYVTDYVPHLKKPLNRIREIPGAAKVLDPVLGKLEETLVLYHPVR